MFAAFCAHSYIGASKMLLLPLLFAVGALSYLITSAPQPMSTPAVTVAGQETDEMYGNLENTWLGRRQDQPMYNCDGKHICKDCGPLRQLRR